MVQSEECGWRCRELFLSPFNVVCDLDMDLAHIVPVYPGYTDIPTNTTIRTVVRSVIVTRFTLYRYFSQDSAFRSIVKAIHANRGNDTFRTGGRRYIQLDPACSH